MAGVKHSRKKIWFILVAFCLVIVYVSLVRPELAYRQAMQKYRVGITVEAIEHDYGVHLDLRPSGNIFPDTATVEEKSRHAAYEAFVPQEYVVVTFNSNREIVDITKLTPLRGIQKFLGL